MAHASAEKLDQTGPAKKEKVVSVPQSGQLARTPDPPFPERKGTEPFVQITRWSGGRESRWSRAAPWRERRELEQEHGEERWISQRREVSMRGRTSKENLPRKSRTKHEWVGDAKALQEDLENLNFTPSLAEPKMGKDVEKRKAANKKDRAK